MKLEHLLNDSDGIEELAKSFSAQRIFFTSGAASTFPSRLKAR